MTLLGLPLGKLVSLFAAAGAAVIVLHILRLRRRRFVVPFGPLWQSMFAEQRASALWRRLRRTTSLLLQLLFIALVVGALGDPRLSDRFLAGRHIVLLVDTSASMQAVERGGLSRFDLAIARGKEIVRRMRGRDRMMIVSLNGHITPLTPFTGDVRQLLDPLDTLRPSDTPANLSRAVSFCRDALHGRRDPLLVLVSDAAYPPTSCASSTPSLRRPARHPRSRSASCKWAAATKMSASSRSAHDAIPSTGVDWRSSSRSKAIGTPRQSSTCTSSPTAC